MTGAEMSGADRVKEEAGALEGMSGPQAEGTVTYGDIQELDVAGCKGKIYADVRDFAAALQSAMPDMILTKTTSMLFYSVYTAAFVDKEGTVHGFILEGYQDPQQVAPLYDLIEESGIKEIDGAITASKVNGDIYYRFSSDTLDEASVQANYDAWLKTVTVQPLEGSRISYIIGDDGVVINLRSRKNHFITVLDGQGNRTLEATLAELPGWPSSDETWFREIQ